MPSSPTPPPPSPLAIILACMKLMEVRMSKFKQAPPHRAAAPPPRMCDMPILVPTMDELQAAKQGG